MNRSQDLDAIAPDDPIIPAKKSAPVKKKKPSVKSDSPAAEPDVYGLLGHTQNSFSSVLVKPKILSFQEQDDGEKIYVGLRPHWINNLSWIVTFVFMIFLPILFKYIDILDIFPVSYVNFILVFWYLFTFIYAFEKFLSWYSNIFIITDQRIIDIDFKNILNKHFVQTRFAQIEDISSSIKGILGTFFNYGDVIIQTASEDNKIKFEKIPNPSKIIMVIKDLQDLDRQKRGGAL
ncbi:MAG TPA: PH domain-containing protein [Candidatus Woesebacteria bacterium]|jgi:hypothetical protein|nr:PH domain-containing protein [Candidatus Woesebacteria bacterium]HOG37740.1 PH domain-containing protein [Candidatus Woesebacteria bacterium]